ncbi:unnamed protein product [Heligmosomoides polygyrus]|uniref:Metalloendopeptidase n=1 Tax=Heligmosomoides polygyrus TaxID=6339 RepID=A0A183G5Q7_HELPZ|nr:unnamed protein product [Heligmosomoides polygyrus]
MRLILLLLLLAVAANGGVFDSLSKKVKGVFGGEGSFGEKLKNATIVGFRKLFNNTAVSGFRQRLKSMKAKVMKTLELSPEMLKSLKERLKHIANKTAAALVVTSLLQWPKHAFHTLRQRPHFQLLRPIKQDKVKEEGDSISDINELNGVGQELFQSDIALTKLQAEEIVEEIEEEASEGNRTKRQAFKDGTYPRKLWSEGVNYYFHPYSSREMRSAFVKGAKLWEQDTCIDFRESSYAKDRIKVFPEDGCWSYVGRLGNEQALSLGRGCEAVSIAAHEIGHALGFFHTMSRHDRDEYITINTANIKPDWLDQFTKETTRTNYNYGMTYDSGSIMHYGARSASRNKQPTMVPMDVRYQETLGSPFISFIDLSMLNEHYNCKAKCNKETSAKCERGGFPHPRDCSKCICPGGYSGKTCTERPSGCGKTVQASSEWETLKDTLGDGRINEDFTKCHYWIQSPQNTQIEVRLVSFSEGVATDGCTYAGVEIKTNEDQTLTGYRFCAPEDAGITLRSYTNLVPIMTYNRARTTTAVLEYRYGHIGKYASDIRTVRSKTTSCHYHYNDYYNNS